MSTELEALLLGVPRKKACKTIALAEVDSSVLIKGITLWQMLCGDRKFPNRNDITVRALKALLRHTMLVRVINGGEDFEYRVVGDAYVMAHGVTFQGQRWSQIAELTPGYLAYVKSVYDAVIRDGEPIATRGWIERGGGSSGHVYCEYVFLPLGDETVDHILVFAVYIRRDGREPVGLSPRGSFGE